MTVSTSAQATATAAMKWVEWSVARGESTSSMVVLITLLEPVSQEWAVLEVETEDQSEASAVTSLGHVESSARLAEARCSPLCCLTLEPEPPSTCTRFVMSEVGGEVRVFSSLHVSGEQLEQLSGLCAILRFPMAELEDTDSDSDNE